MTYPDGRVLTYSYGSAVDDVSSRLAALIEDDGTTALESYTYLGDGTLVQRRAIPDLAQNVMPGPKSFGNGNRCYACFR